MTDILIEKENNKWEKEDPQEELFEIFTNNMISQEKIDEIADTITSKIRYRIRDESWLNVYPPIAPLVTLEEARKEDESIGVTFREEEFQKLNGGRKI